MYCRQMWANNFYLRFQLQNSIFSIYFFIVSPDVWSAFGMVNNSHCSKWGIFHITKFGFHVRFMAHQPITSTSSLCEWWSIMARWQHTGTVSFAESNLCWHSADSKSLTVLVVTQWIWKKTSNKKAQTSIRQKCGYSFGYGLISFCLYSDKV